MTKSDQNIHQNVPNCTIFFKFSCGCMPPNPPSKGHATYKCKNKKTIPPPLPNFGFTPVVHLG